MVNQSFPIEISTVDDALAALKRNRGSFEEWMDCANIFAKHSMWKDLETAASKALSSVVNRPMRTTLLIEAAQRFAAGNLGDFKSRSDFENNCRSSLQEVKKLKKSVPRESKKFHAYIDSLTQALDEILILLADGSPEALTSIASKLRKKLARPDLCIRVADIALRQDPSVMPGYVTRGSAYIDLGEFSRAEKDLKFAESDQKSRPFALASHTRLLIRQGKFEEALLVGDELFLRKVSRPVILLMIAAARGANNKREFERFMKLAELSTDPGRGSGRTLLLRQTIRILIENKQFDTAQKLIEEIARFDKPGQLKRLRQSLDKARNAQIESIPT